MRFLTPDHAEQHLRLGEVVGTPPLRECFQYGSSVILVWDENGPHLGLLKGQFNLSDPTLFRMLYQCLHTLEHAHRLLLFHGHIGEDIITALVKSFWDNIIIVNWGFP